MPQRTILEMDNIESDVKATIQLEGRTWSLPGADPIPWFEALLADFTVFHQQVATATKPRVHALEAALVFAKLCAPEAGLMQNLQKGAVT
jgi:hypothetical protein